MSLRARNWILVLETGSTSANGTFETCWHVRSMVAIGGIADIEKTALNKRVSSHKSRPSNFPIPTSRIIGDPNHVF